MFFGHYKNKIIINDKGPRNSRAGYKIVAGHTLGGTIIVNVTCNLVNIYHIMVTYYKSITYVSNV